MAKRASLANFSPAAMPDAGRVVAPAPEPITAAITRKSYPSVTVYLDAQEIRTLKLLNIETGEKVSDMCARAIREWLQRGGHARTNDA